MRPVPPAFCSCPPSCLLMFDPACLCAQGANPSIADGALGCTALHYASMYGHADVVRVLLPRVDNLDEQRWGRSRLVVVYKCCAVLCSRVDELLGLFLDDCWLQQV
eukprot:1148800-Pelagomonas_calceolata.AAC.6